MLDIDENNDSCMSVRCSKHYRVHAQYSAHIPSKVIFILLDVFNSTPWIFQVCTQSTKQRSQKMPFSIFRVNDIFLKHHRMFSLNRNNK